MGKYLILIKVFFISSILWLFFHFGKVGEQVKQLKKERKADDQFDKDRKDIAGMSDADIIDELLDDQD